MCLIRVFLFWIFLGVQYFCDIYTEHSYTMHIISIDTVDSLLFVGYQFPWISNSWVQVNQEIKYSTNYIFSLRVYEDFCKTTKSNIHENTSFQQSTKIGTHDSKGIHWTLGKHIKHTEDNFWMETKIKKHCPGLGEGRRIQIW